MNIKKAEWAPGTEEEIYPQPEFKPAPRKDEDPTITSAKEFKVVDGKSNRFLKKIFTKNPGLKKQAQAKPKAPTEKEQPLVGNSHLEQRHQRRVVGKLQDEHPRLLAFHGLGSGKTLTGLRAAQEAQRRGEKVLAITPASLTKNIDKEMKKHKINLKKKDFQVMSYEKAVRNIDKLKEGKYGLIIADEAHKLREEDTQRFKQLEPVLQRNTKQLLLLSGSPLYNKPENLSTLVNLLAKKKVLPEDKERFEKEYINTKHTNPGLIRRIFFGAKPENRQELKNQRKLKRIMDDYVDYYNPNDNVQQKAFYPDLTEEEVEVPMTKKQQRYYAYFEEKLPPHLKWKLRMNMPTDKRESAQLNAFLSGLRQVSNSHAPFTKGMNIRGSSPKIETAVSHLIKEQQKDPRFKGLVYSNYLKAGVEPYVEALSKSGIKHQIITGDLSAKEKQRIVKDYNSGKAPVLIVSSSGGEGLDLTGTKLVQILDPHWNKSKIDQVVGRARRYKSHMHLPKEERRVKVEHYVSTLQPNLLDKALGIKPTSVDQYLRNRMKEKDQINSQIKELLSEQK